MGKIHERFINEAIRIRKEYIKNIQNIQEKEIIIYGYKDKIENAMANIGIYINTTNSDLTEKLKNELNDELIEMEKNISKINSELEPFKLNIEQLQKESTVLYKAITEKYPNLTQVEIQKQIFNKIPE